MFIVYTAICTLVLVVGIKISIKKRFSEKYLKKTGVFSEKLVIFKISRKNENKDKKIMEIIGNYQIKLE